MGGSTDLITDEIVDAYRRDGVVLVRQALDPEWLMLLEMGLARALGDAGMVKHRFFADTPGEFQETVRNFDYVVEIRRLLYDSPLADMMATKQPPVSI